MNTPNKRFDLMDKEVNDNKDELDEIKKEEERLLNILTEEEQKILNVIESNFMIKKKKDSFVVRVGNEVKGIIPSRLRIERSSSEVIKEFNNIMAKFLKISVKNSLRKRNIVNKLIDNNEVLFYIEKIPFSDEYRIALEARGSKFNGSTIQVGEELFFPLDIKVEDGLDGDVYFELKSVLINNLTLHDNMKDEIESFIDKNINRILLTLDIIANLDIDREELYINEYGWTKIEGVTDEFR